VIDAILSTILVAAAVAAVYGYTITAGVLAATAALGAWAWVTR
jgi:hypothetical protein